VGTVKKPSVVCEALFKPLWESAFFADFHQGRQFPQAFRTRGQIFTTHGAAVE
jgi:hypothetical protein